MSASTLAAVACVHFALVDRIDAAIDGLGPVDLNGVVALAVLVPVATTIFALRRYRDSVEVHQELARLSLRDGLTGLPNRLFLSEWLETELKRTRRGDVRVAVLFIDLDRFKLINDTHGHEVGDALLAALAGRLRTCAEAEDDRVVRYAGDEFIIVTHDEPMRPNTSIRMARRVLAALDDPFAIGTESLRVAASVGIAVSDGTVTGDELLRRADAAMYDAKGRDDGQPVVYDQDVHGRRFTPATLEPHLRAAAERGDFRLVFQPVVDVSSGHLVAVETLLRWDHPTRGPVGPDEFVPVLEESGLIVPVGAWVLTEALRQARAWNHANPHRDPLRVTINVSARQLAHAGFEDTVRAALRESPVPPSTICLEITEGALMVDIDQAWSALRALKRMGVKLALDDFGTGYSSLSYLRQFSLDLLKVDKSFVDGLGTSAEDTAIVEHVIGMARALGMVTVAEGVETPQQLAELNRLGCQLVQGYLLSPPVGAAEISAMLSRGTNLGRATVTPQLL
ncbi:MAG TPA: bifunctional diguanylate cyclase/phosphodiesterase [Iamia sp.]|nr:bifunctional diguanylate cyclase/phosphodiesterase [Iamia sp.]